MKDFFEKPLNEVSDQVRRLVAKEPVERVPLYERGVTPNGLTWPLLVPTHERPNPPEIFSLPRLWRCCAQQRLVEGGLGGERQRALETLSVRLRQLRAPLTRPARATAADFYAYLAALRRLMCYFDCNHSPLPALFPGAPDSSSLTVEYAQALLLGACHLYQQQQGGTRAEAAALLFREFVTTVTRPPAATHHWSVRPPPTSLSSSARPEAEQAPDPLASLLEEAGGALALETRVLLFEAKHEEARIARVLERLEGATADARHKALHQVVAPLTERLRTTLYGEISRRVPGAALGRYARFMSQHWLVQCELALAKADWALFDKSDVTTAGVEAAKRALRRLEDLIEAEDGRPREAVTALYVEIKEAIVPIYGYNRLVIDLPSPARCDAPAQQLTFDALLVEDASLSDGFDALAALVQAEQERGDWPRTTATSTRVRSARERWATLDERVAQLDWLLGLVDRRGQIVLVAEDVQFLRQGAEEARRLMDEFPAVYS